MWYLQLRLFLDILSLKETYAYGVEYLQFNGGKLLYDVLRLRVEDPEERLVGKAW